MAEIWHNKRKVTDAFFVTMVSEYLYIIVLEQWLLLSMQGCGTPIDLVLQAATAVKILTENFLSYSITLIIRFWVLSLEFMHLTLDNLDHLHQKIY